MMMKKLIPAAALLVVMGAAQAQVAVYGLVDVGFSSKDNGAATVNALTYSNNSTSRLGVKGSADLGAGVKANFDVQTGFNVTGPTTVGNRQAWVSFSGKFGEVRLGNQDTVAFRTFIDFDLNGAANDTYQGLGLGVLNTLGQNANFANAGKELATYISPKMNDFQATVGFLPAGNNKDAATGGKSYFALGLNYSKGPLAAAFAYEGASTDDTTKQANNAWSSLAVSYDLGVVKLNGQFVNGGTGQKGSQIGISAPVAGATVGIQYVKNSDTNITGTELFVNKEVFKNTYAYAEYGVDNKTVKSTNYSLGVMYVF